MLRKLSSVNSYPIANELENYRFKTIEQDFQVAIGLEKFQLENNKALNDPTFVKWIALNKNHEGDDKLFRLQPCTETDFAKFHPPDVNIIDELANLKDRGTLFCLDW